MKRWQFTYRTKSGREKIINNENCWKHLEEDLWKGITWCGDHLGVICLGAGATLLTILATRPKKPEADIVYNPESRLGYIETKDGIGFFKSITPEEFEEDLAKSSDLITKQ